MNKKEKRSQKLQIQQTQDTLKIIYMTLNHSIILNRLISHLESSESRASEKGKIAYSIFQNRGYHLVQNLEEAYISISQGDLLGTFISQRICKEIKSTLDKFEIQKEKLLEISPVRITPN